MRKKRKNQLHALKQQQYKEKQKADRLNTTSDPNTLSYEDIPKLPPRSNPEDIYHAQVLLGIYKSFMRPVAHSSRLVLSDYTHERVMISGYIAAIKYKRHKTGELKQYILITSPNAYRGNNSNGRRIDSHLWFSVDDIRTCSYTPLYLSIGNIINFTASVNPYKGRVNDQYELKGYKYGLIDIDVIASGYPHIKGSTIIAITYDYPRHHDWILKWYSPGDYETKHAQPQYNQEFIID